MTKMAAMPKYGKNLKIYIFFWNQKSHDLEIWHTASSVCINGQCHINNMVATPILGKNLKNLLLKNKKADDLETWHSALENQAPQSLYK